MTDCAQFSAAAFAVIEAGVTGEDMWKALKNEVSGLKDSFMNNIVRNPSVFEVTSYALKGIAIASALASGGILTGVAVGLFALSELNKRYDIAEQAFGPKAGAIVSLGVELAASGALIWAGGGFDDLAKVFKDADLGETLNVVKAMGSILQGAIIAGTAVDNYYRTNEMADDIDRQADLESIRNRIARLDRAMQALMGEFEAGTEHAERIQKHGANAFQLQAAGIEAAVIRA
jgi:hypothetical protein